MKKLITTIQNIFKIEDLRVRIMNTLWFLLIYRIGTFIVLPGVDSSMLKGSTSGLLDTINMFAGGAFSRASIFALGIMPYISASIVMQLLTIAVPSFQRMQKEGEDGRRKINQYTRVLTILITAVQAISYIINLRGENAAAIISETNPGILSPMAFTITSVIILIAGTMFTMWLGEKITDKGLGNGISLIIMVGIIARLPNSLWSELQAKFGGAGGGMFFFVLEIALWLAIILFVILLVQGTRKIPVQFAKRVVGNRQYGGVRQYIPLKVNAAGVMPIIFAQALMFIPVTVAGLFPNSGTAGSFITTFSNNTTFGYNLVFAILIILFTYFYTAITVNPTQIADDMKRNSGYVPGIKPGRPTAQFIDTVMSRITLPGSILLALVAILPSIATIANVNGQFAQFFGGTSLLILVGVVLDTLQQIESHLLMRHYDGLMKTGRIKGRTAVGAA